MKSDLLLAVGIVVGLTVLGVAGFAAYQHANRPERIVREPAGTGSCPKPNLPDGVVVHIGWGGGFTGETTNIDVRDDGEATVVLDGGATNDERGTVKLALGRAWVESLDRDVAATGVFAEPSACWERAGGPMPDSLGGGFTIRHGGTVYAWHALEDGTIPPSITAAQALVSTRGHELRRAAERVLRQRTPADAGR